MKPAFILGVLIAAIAMPVQAQDSFGLGPGSRPKRPEICMNNAELEAEAQTRAGIVLRAFARTCAARGVDNTILPKWGVFDAANADKLQEAVRLRNEAYVRNYPNDAYAGQRVIDETLASRGITHPSQQECLAVADVVNGLSAWEDFVAHARRTQLGLVKTQIKSCKPRRPGG